MKFDTGVFCNAKTSHTGAICMYLAGKYAGVNMPLVKELCKNKPPLFKQWDTTFMSESLTEHDVKHSRSDDFGVNSLRMFLDVGMILCRLNMWAIPKGKHNNRAYTVYQPYDTSWVYISSYNTIHHHTLQCIDPRTISSYSGREYDMEPVIDNLTKLGNDIILIPRPMF